MKVIDHDRERSEKGDVQVPIANNPLPDDGELFLESLKKVFSSQFFLVTSRPTFGHEAIKHNHHSEVLASSQAINQITTKAQKRRKKIGRNGSDKLNQFQEQRRN